jgi:hypothetical protein
MKEEKGREGKKRKSGRQKNWKKERERDKIERGNNVWNNLDVLESAKGGLTTARTENSKQITDKGTNNSNVPPDQVLDQG